MNDDQQQADAANSNYDQLFNSVPSAPAPGAPAGPVSQDDAPATDTPVIAPDAPADPTNLDVPSTAASFGPNNLPLDDASEESESTEAPAPADGPAPASDALLDIKQDALHELAPLVGQLEQSPEEKFKTTMMMIQASDDQSLVKAAYEAAKEIQDEKARAQALLDVVNEINYFTQQSSSQS